MRSKNAARIIAPAAFLLSAIPSWCQFAAPAAGADFYRPSSGPMPGEAVEFASNWYIRGDIAYAQETFPELEPDFSFGPSRPMRSALSAGAGMGYKFNDWFRADFVAEYRTPVQAWGIGTAQACLAATGTGACTFDSVIHSWDLLANAYFDLATWQGVTPYIGAGVGTASSRVTQTANGFGNIAPSEAVLTQRFRFAFAAMAGVAIAVTDHVQLDAGYRFLDLGTMTAPSSITGALETKTLYSHELRGGLRYMID
jgi:opacity protein-like surface antigen